jgi:hypothetical protein
MKPDVKGHQSSRQDGFHLYCFPGLITGVMVIAPSLVHGLANALWLRKKGAAFMSHNDLLHGTFWQLSFKQGKLLALHGGRDAHAASQRRLSERETIPPLRTSFRRANPDTYPTR